MKKPNKSLRSLTARATRLVLLDLVCFLALSSTQAQQNALLLADFPERTVIQKNDTLLSVFSQRIRETGRWSNLRKVDPHLDYPEQTFSGDILKPDFQIGGSPISVERGNGRDVNPGLRLLIEHANKTGAPELSMAAMETSFSGNRLVSRDQFDTAPIIVQNLKENLLINAGDEVLAIGSWPEGEGRFGIYRRGREYFANSAGLGPALEADYLGNASLTGAGEDNRRHLQISSSVREIKVGDRLLTQEVLKNNASVVAITPDIELEGDVIGIHGDQLMASMMDSVVLDLGAQVGLREGAILTVREAVQPVVEPDGAVSAKRLPARAGGSRGLVTGAEIGTVLVYKIFDRLSYALVVNSTRPVVLQNRVTSP